MTTAQKKKGASGREGAAEALGRFGRMVLIRRFEEEMQRLFLRGEIHGTTHLYNGQEAISVGVCGSLADGDRVAATYRGHGAALALGVPPLAVAAELMGRTAGIDGGRGGSMNLIDISRGLVGCFGIVGGSIAAATGAAIAAARTGGVAVAFFGDGATNQGYFHECLNFAAVRRLPAIFVCENNLYGEFTPMLKVTAGGDIARRAAAYGMPAEKVDGNAIEAVRDAAARAIRHCRGGDGPFFLECETYRHLGHSKSDPGRYRPSEEVEAWMGRDPIELERVRLGKDAGLGEGELDAEVERVEAELAAAIEAALAAPVTSPENDTATEYAA